jgi:hypothetical protein
MTSTIIGQAVNATLGQVIYGERHPARGVVILAVVDRALDLIDEPRRQLLRADNFYVPITQVASECPAAFREHYILPDQAHVVVHMLQFR